MKLKTLKCKEYYIETFVKYRDVLPLLKKILMDVENNNHRSDLTLEVEEYNNLIALMRLLDFDVNTSSSPKNIYFDIDILKMDIDFFLELVDYVLYNIDNINTLYCEIIQAINEFYNSDKFATVLRFKTKIDKILYSIIVTNVVNTLDLRGKNIYNCAYVDDFTLALAKEDDSLRETEYWRLTRIMLSIADRGQAVDSAEELSEMWGYEFNSLDEFLYIMNKLEGNYLKKHFKDSDFYITISPHDDEGDYYVIFKKSSTKKSETK